MRRTLAPKILVRKSFRCVSVIANDHVRLQCDEKKSRNSSLESSRNYPCVPNSPGELRSGNRQAPRRRSHSSMLSTATTSRAPAGNFHVRPGNFQRVRRETAQKRGAPAPVPRPFPFPSQRELLVLQSHSWSKQHLTVSYELLLPLPHASRPVLVLACRSFLLVYTEITRCDCGRSDALMPCVAR